MSSSTRSICPPAATIQMTVRERRAVFMQNVWRAHLGRKLPTDYHGRFATLDYQDAARRGAVGELARYIFTRSDFPPPGSSSR
jgi:hypothetical protein